MSHALRRRLADVAEKGGSGPSSAMSKWPLRWPWYQRSITLRNVAVPSPLKTDDFVATSATASPAAIHATTPAPSPVIKHVIPALAVRHVAPALVIEYVSFAPVIEYMAPAPAVTLSVPSQQLSPAYTTTTDTTADIFDITDLVHPQFSFTAVEAFSPLVVGSLPPLEEFDALVYDQIHQVQIVAGEMTQHRVENPAVQEQASVQEISQVPQVVDSFPPLQEFVVPMCNQVLQERIVATVQPHVRFSRNSRDPGC